jgi:hypothetical protein
VFPPHKESPFAVFQTESFRGLILFLFSTSDVAARPGAVLAVDYGSRKMWCSPRSWRTEARGVEGGLVSVVRS